MPTTRGTSAPSRPRSLEAVESLGRVHGDVDSFLREFLDEFYSEPDREHLAAMLANEPALSENSRLNAYLAAVAEHLALLHDIGVPEWVSGPDRFLKRPFFPAGLESLKATLLMESPASFRRRMIFVGAEPLYRPRKRLAHMSEVHRGST